MNGRILVLLGCMFFLAACATETQTPESSEAAPTASMEEPAGPRFLALHLFNLASTDAEQQLLAMLADLNEAVAGAGHPETSYNVWKVTGEQSGDYEYLFGSFWADSATYNAVHDHPDYKAAMERIEESGVEPIDEETYNRYVELGQETADSSAVTTSAEEPADPRFLALHLFNLPSADAEQQLLAMLADFNQMLTDIGLPETRYNVWKVTGDQSGAYTYLFGSVWANRAAYDEAHEHPDYVAMQDEHREVYEALIPEEVYNRYVELRQE